MLAPPPTLAPPTTAVNGTGGCESPSDVHQAARGGCVARWAAAIGFVAGAVLVTACASTGTSPWWRQTGTSSCGPPALMRVAGQVTWLGNCAAMFVTPAVKVTVHVGQDIDVHM